MSQPLTAADLAEARAYSSGSIWRMEPGAIVSDDDCERIQAAEAATDIGAEPDSQRSRPGLGIALVALPWALGVICWAALARMG